MSRLARTFFERKTETVAKDLLGKLLVRKVGKILRIGVVVETEAYLGSSDLASHSARGMTKRNQVMFGPAGFAYVYFTYGMHWLLNFITEKEGIPSGVLIRSVEPIFDSEINLEQLSKVEKKSLGSGPARLTKWLGIGKEENNLDITKSSSLFVADKIKVGEKIFQSQKISKGSIAEVARVGVGYAREHKDLPLRFYITESQFISKK